MSFTAPSFLGEAIGDELIFLYVGSERKRFAIHKNLLCSSVEYFKNAFTTGFSEQTKAEMELPEDSPGAIALFIDWLYRSQLPSGRSQSYLDSLFDLCFFADKTCLPILHDRAIDCIRKVYSDYREIRVTPGLLAKVYKNTREKSRLRKLCIDHMIYDISKEEILCLAREDWIVPTLSDDNSAMILQLGMEHPDLHRDYLRCVKALLISEYESDPARTNPRDRNSCYYHSHNVLERCKKEREADTSAVAEWVDDSVSK